ncbi:hypothetical protein H5986_11260 [Fusobacterium mortiferum]|nr:hypothetical protein [Fusobacterium mortiferum]
MLPKYLSCQLITNAGCTCNNLNNRYFSNKTLPSENIKTENKYFNLKYLKLRVG